MIGRWIQGLIDKVTRWCVGLGIDVFLHVLATMLIAWLVALGLTVCRLAGWLALPDVLPGLVGVAVAIVAGALKEKFDERGGGVFSMEDLQADFVGAAFFYLIYVL